MSGHIGREPIPEASRVRYPKRFTTPFDTVEIPGGYQPGNVEVHINGVLLDPGVDYDDTNGTSIDFIEEIPATTENPVSFRFESIRQYTLPQLNEVMPSAWATVGGTADAIELATRYTEATRTTLRDGDTVRFRASLTNTDDFTIDWDGLGAKQCVTASLSVAPAGYIRTDVVTTAVWDATNDWFVVDREVERGSNANGEYVKHADGYITQWLTGDVSAAPINVDPGGDVINARIWNFPAPFFDTEYFTGGVVLTDMGDAATSGSLLYDDGSLLRSTTQVSFFREVEGSTPSGGVSLIANGNWYEYVDPTA